MRTGLTSKCIQVLPGARAQEADQQAGVLPACPRTRPRRATRCSPVVLETRTRPTEAFRTAIPEYGGKLATIN